MLSFADDTPVFLSDSDSTNLFNRANKSLGDIFNWFVQIHKLSLNPNKTQYMVIQPATKHNTFQQYNLNIGGLTLSQATSCKCIGIILDDSLSWKKQLSNIKIARYEEPFLQ